MGWEYFLKKFTKQLAAFFKDSGDRWSDATEKVADGTYTAAELKDDLTDSATDAIGLWATMLSFAGATSGTPIVRDTSTAAALTTTPLHLVAQLDKPMPGAVLTVGDSDKLVLSSDTTKTLDAVAIIYTADQDQVRVTVGPESAAPTAGTYYGAVFDNGTDLIAIAIVDVT